MNPSKRKKLYRAGLLGGKDTLPEAVEEFKAEVIVPEETLKVDEVVALLPEPVVEEPAVEEEVSLEPAVEEEVPKSYKKSKK
jgi:hypothetical protein